ncbi:MAG: hypothetical protein JXR03_05315 [Cyclobacteriaceae bacterium]
MISLSNQKVPNQVLDSFIKLKGVNTLDNLSLIENILDMSYGDVFDPFTEEDFFKYFYSTNDLIDNALEGLVNSISNNYRFHFLHSYGKNGKSTFLKYLQFCTKNHDHAINWKYIDFDFKKGSGGNAFENAHSLKHKCLYFFNLYILPKNPDKSRSENFDDNVKKLNEFVVFCEDEIGFGAHFDIDQDRNYSYIFESFLTFFRLETEEYYEASGNTAKRRQFYSEIDDKIIQLGDDEMGKLLCFIILFLIYQNRDSLKSNSISEKSRHKLILIFDNLDDIRSHLSALAYSNSAEYIDGFLKFLTLIKVREKLGNIQTDDVSIIFSYRTANLINAINIHKKKYSKSQNERERHDYGKTFMISTIKNSPKILSQRLDFYSQICKRVSIKPDSRIKIIESFTHFLNTKVNKKEGEVSRIHFTGKNEAEDFNKIFKLLNGNRTYISDLIKEQGISDSFKYFDRLNADYLRKGVFIFHFLSLLEKRKSSDLKKAVEYLFITFNKDIEKERCSLKRLILTFIINASNKNPDRKNFKDVDSIATKGVSLYEILSRFQKSPYMENYSVEDFEDFFNAVFHEEIDDWGHLLSCYKDTSFKDEDGVKRAGKFLDFNKDLSDFFGGDSSTFGELKNIRFFYNANAEYLITHVIKHFEYYSHFVDNSRPLSSYVGYKFEGGEFKFDFEEPTSKVFKRVNDCITSITKFFTNNFDSPNAINEFETDNLAINNRMFYSDLISKHITYLDQFRMNLKEIYENDSDFYLIPDRERFFKDLNQKTLLIITRYIGLFNLVTSRFQREGFLLSKSLQDTVGAFNRLSDKADSIKKDDYRYSSYISISN